MSLGLNSRPKIIWVPDELPNKLCYECSNLQMDISLSLKPNPLQVVGRVTLDQATGILLSLVPITLPAHRKDEHLAWIREVVFNGILEWAKQ